MKKIILTDEDYSLLIHLLEQIDREASVCRILDCKDICGELPVCCVSQLMKLIKSHTRTMIDIGESQ